MTYYLPEATLIRCINLLSLINGEAVLYITTDRIVKLNDKEKVNRSCF